MFKSLLELSKSIQDLHPESLASNHIRRERLLISSSSFWQLLYERDGRQSPYVRINKILISFH